MVGHLFDEFLIEQFLEGVTTLRRTEARRFRRNKGTMYEELPSGVLWTENDIVINTKSSYTF